MKIKCTFAIFLVAISVALLACSPAASPPAAPPTTPQSQLTNENWSLVQAEAQGTQKAYIDLPVILTGKVRQIISGTGNETQLIIDTKSNNSPLGQDTLVVSTTGLAVKEGDSVKAQGKLGNYWTTTSAAGVKITIPVVNADNVTVVSP